LAGVDCAVYAAASVIFIGFGLAGIAHALTSGDTSSDVATGLVFIGLGALTGMLPAFRIWQVDRALRRGDAQMAEVIEAEVGRARIYGTPWGEPMMAGGMQPIAARGTYRLDGTGENGKYYMQQRWAAALRPGARIWVLRRGRHVVYAPIARLAPDVR
jgi:hypothetical protein